MREREREKKTLELSRSSWCFWILHCHLIDWERERVGEWETLELQGILGVLGYRTASWSRLRLHMSIVQNWSIGKKIDSQDSHLFEVLSLIVYK